MVAYVRLDGQNIKVEVGLEDHYAVCYRVVTFWRVYRLVHDEADARHVATLMERCNADEIVIAPLRFDEW